MSFAIEWHPQAFKKVQKLPKPIIERILKRLDFVCTDPFRYIEHYEGAKVYKLRIGDYRALIDVQQNVLLIQEFDHRSRIYKR